MATNFWYWMGGGKKGQARRDARSGVAAFNKQQEAYQNALDSLSAQYGGLSSSAQQQLNLLNQDTKRNYWSAQQQTLNQLGGLASSSLGRQQSAAGAGAMTSALGGNYANIYNQDYANWAGQQQNLAALYQNAANLYGQQGTAAAQGQAQRRSDFWRTLIGAIPQTISALK